jgi:hypothetical protein
VAAQDHLFKAERNQPIGRFGTQDRNPAWRMDVSGPTMPEEIYMSESSCWKHGAQELKNPMKSAGTEFSLGAPEPAGVTRPAPHQHSRSGPGDDALPLLVRHPCPGNAPAPGGRRRGGRGARPQLTARKFGSVRSKLLSMTATPRVDRGNPRSVAASSSKVAHSMRMY